MKNYIRKAQLNKQKEHKNLEFKEKPTKYQCKKCNFTWVEIDSKIIKVWCPKDNLVMVKVKNGKENL